VIEEIKRLMTRVEQNPQFEYPDHPYNHHWELILKASEEQGQ